MQRTARRRTAPRPFTKTRSLQITLVDSLVRRSVAATLRLCRLPRGSPVRGVLANAAPRDLFTPGG
jgi:hypothetical protein